MSKVLNASVIVEIVNSYGVTIKSQPLPITQHNYRRFVNNMRTDDTQKAIITFVEGSKSLLKNEIAKDTYFKNVVVNF